MKRTGKRVLAFVVLLLLVVGAAFLLRPVSIYDGLIFLGDKINGVQHQSIVVDGYRMHYLALGPAEGEPVVLIHGLGGRAEDWRLLAPHIGKSGFRVYMPDLPGYGRSDRPKDFSYSVHDEATIVVDFIKALGLQQVNLGGWSMGGWIVQIVATQHPEAVRRLMLFDAAGLYVKPDWDTSLFVPKNAAQLDQLEALLMPRPTPIPSFVARDILRISHAHAWVLQRALNTMLTGADTTDGMLPALKMPVLILWGAEDRIVPLSNGQKMHELVRQSELDVFNGCGHLAPQQCADEMAPRLVDFLKQ